MTRTVRAAAAAMMLIAVVATATPVAAATAPTETAQSPVATVTTSPTSLNLYDAAGFLHQDPNMYACTSTSVMQMLNYIAIKGTGGTAFRWKVDRTGATRDYILQWERRNDTLAGGYGSDPHGWRNAMNVFGWGSGAVPQGSRYYEDVQAPTYDRAVKAAVRALIRYRKPVGLLAWAGKHGQVMTGYYGLVGDPFKRNSAGYFTDEFTVQGFYISDPLKSQALVNARISYSYLKTAANLKLRFRPYLETDSPYDDPYTAGTVASWREWYNKFVMIMPVK